jgi:pre-mRNA-splicing factor ATP-dependent RNA helicase DHX15/PRP43
MLLTGGTGSGKSLLLPKYALHSVDYKGRVVMTLPKKIITKKAAEFGAKTLDVQLGEQVGYQFRGDSLKSNKTVLLYSTDGSIISQIKSDPLLRSIDILLIDEAHERKVQIDLLLYMLKNTIKMRKEKNMRALKLIIMSATINEKIFSDYYKDFSYDYMFLSGTPNYPIETIYLESSLNIKSNEYLESGTNIILNLVEKLNKKELPQGDILFFVCTIRECNEIAELLGTKCPDSFTMGLYSGFEPELEQYISNPEKYLELNPNFVRRIFVSTNVAESSLTIDGIVYVVDSGLELSVKYDPERKINIMSKHFITKAQMAQRKGRAGRTKLGYCYKLYTPKEEESAIDFPDPEIKQIDLKNVCLSLMKIGSDITKSDYSVEQTIEMFTQFIEPPNESYIVDGFDFSIGSGIISPEGFITPIGKLIVDSRLDVMDGLTMLYAYNISSIAFKKVFKIISICSIIKSGPEDFFYSDINPDTKTNILNRFKKTSSNSEHILLYQIYKFIESDPNESIFNLDLFKQIEQVYSKQIDKITRIYEKANISIDVEKKDLDHNVICAFNYGYKTNRAFRRGKEFKFNNINCNLDKLVFDYSTSTYSSIIFYSNIMVNGKFNIGICSPFLLELA